MTTLTLPSSTLSPVIPAPTPYIRHLHSHHPTSTADIRVHSPTPLHPPHLINRPTCLEYSNLRFVILDAPTSTNLPSYLDYFRRKNVVAIARACEPTYDSRQLTEAG